MLAGSGSELGAQSGEEQESSSQTGSTGTAADCCSSALGSPEESFFKVLKEWEVKMREPGHRRVAGQGSV